MNCCEQILALSAALTECDTVLIPDIRSLVCSYVVGHWLVKPKSGQLRNSIWYVDTLNNAPMTMDVLRRNLELMSQKKDEATKGWGQSGLKYPISDWKWHVISNKTTYAIIEMDTSREGSMYTKASANTLGTLLELTTLGNYKKKKTMCITGLDVRNEVEVALFLLSRGTPAVRKSICPIYLDTLRYDGELLLREDGGIGQRDQSQSCPVAGSGATDL